MDTEKHPQEREFKYWLIEFLLDGKANSYHGSCQGTDPQGAIMTFLESYSQSMGTIMAIRVARSVATGSVAQHDEEDAESAAIRSHLADCDLCNEDYEVFCPLYWTAGLEPD